MSELQKYLIVGLGNPGPKYSLTRHNIGFILADIFAKSLGDLRWSEERKAEVTKYRGQNLELIIAKPQTFMNLSGESVQLMSAFYKVELDHILVLQDDIDQAFGKIRFHKNRGHGGHNGIRSISQVMGTQDYVRLKLGVGRPTIPEMNVADYVLGHFSKEEQSGLEEFLNRGLSAIDCYLKKGLSSASTEYNG